MSGIAGEDKNLYSVGSVANNYSMVVRYDPMPTDGEWFTHSDVKSNGEYKYPIETWNTWRYIRISSRDVTPGTTRDIAYEPKSNTPGDGVIWLAVGDDSSYPIKSFLGNQPSSSKVYEQLPASIGFGSDIHGLAFQKGERGERFLWVNNNSDKAIYKIDLDKETSLSVGSNSYDKEVLVKTKEGSGLIELSWSGLSEKVTLNIFDLIGRRILKRDLSNNCYTWDKNSRRKISTGIYFIQVIDEDNRIGTTTLLIQ